MGEREAWSSGVSRGVFHSIFDVLYDENMQVDAEQHKLFPSKCS